MSDKHPREETPTERLLREALGARAEQITVQSLRPATPPKTRIRRLRPVYTVAVPLFGLAAGVLGYVTINGSAMATHQDPGPAAPVTASPSPSASGSASPSPAASSSATATATETAVVVNGTAKNHLTISNGTQYVVMNGTTVDFGAIVRDLAWSPDGSKAAFVDDSGDLVVSNPDGSGRVVVAKNPGGQTWSHPAWQVTAVDTQYNRPAKNNLFFAVTDGGGVSRLEEVSAGAANGTPQPLGLGGYPDPGVPPLPQTGNEWPNGGGPHGSAVYANSTTGDVFIRDDYLRQNGGAVTKGSEPALSPDGNEIVFVRSVGGHDHLFEGSSYDRSKPDKDLTPDATTDYTEPVWSPDGKTIAVRTPDGISTLPADGSAAPAQVSTYTGLPAYRG